MTATVSLSARVSPQVRDRLTAAAAARGMRLATYAAQLLSGASAETRQPGEGAVQAEVERPFADIPPDASLKREICLALARTVEAGGSAGIAAGRELLSEVSHAQTYYGPDYEDEDPEPQSS